MRLGLPLFASALVVAGLALPAMAEDQAAIEASVSKAIDFLGKTQAEDGSFTAFAGPGVTAIVVTGVLRNGRSPEDPLVAKSLKYLESFVQEDGGIHPKDSNYKNYETCLAILAFEAANKNGKYDELLKKAEAYVKGMQWDKTEGHEEDSMNFGGAGYGKHARPDLSNTNFLIDALKATGNGPDDESMKKALAFVSRCQNLETEHNTTPFAAKVEDGGFFYTPADGGSSQAGTTPDGGLRSYGSMTYAGLKSMLYAGVGPDDPRVKAASDWVKKHYTLEENPGVGTSGLFYYYHTFSKALDATGQDVIVDSNGKEHNWREELAKALIDRQKPDGSWINTDERWLEGDAGLVTGYALLCLSYCQPKEAEAKK